MGIRKTHCGFNWTSLVAQTVETLPTTWEDLSSIPGLGRSPGGGHRSPLQHSCWRIPWTEEPVARRLQSMGLRRVGPTERF